MIGQELQTSRLAVALCVLLIAACSSGRRSVGGDAGQGDIDAGSDADADADADSDSDSDSDTESDTDTVPAGWHWMYLPIEDSVLAVDLHDIVGISLDDIVAGGNIHHTGMLTYDGCSWQLEPPLDEGGDNFSRVCKTGDGTYYAAGFHGPGAGEDFVATREDGQWTEIPPPDWCSQSQPHCYHPLFKIHMDCLDEDNLALFSLFDDGDTLRARLSLYDGEEWSWLAESADGEFWPFGLSLDLARGFSPSEIYLFGEDSLGSDEQRGVLFDGQGATELDLPASPDRIIYGLNGDPEHGYWAVGVTDGSFTVGLVYHSPDMKSWEEVEVPHPEIDTHDGESFRDVWVTEKGDVYVVGHRRHEQDPDDPFSYPVLLHFDGQDWTDESEALPDAIPEWYEYWDEYSGAHLEAIWGEGGELFVAAGVGIGGTSSPGILRYHSTGEND